MDIYSVSNLYWAIYSYKDVLVVDSKGTTVSRTCIEIRTRIPVIGHRRETRTESVARVCPERTVGKTPALPLRIVHLKLLY